MVARTKINMRGAVVCSLRSGIESDVSARKVGGTIRMIAESSIERYWVATGTMGDLHAHVDEADETNETIDRFLIIAREAQIEAERQLVNVILAIAGDRTDRVSGIIDPDGDYCYLLIPGAEDSITLAVVESDEVKHLLPAGTEHSVWAN